MTNIKSDDVITYSYEKKKRLAKKVSQLKRKEDMVKVLEIIYEDNQNITENQNGLFMFFHKLDDSTYHKIDLYLRSITKKKTSTSSEKNNFITFAKNEFSDTHINSVSSASSKLKYSNKERNIIKRQRYSEQLQNDNNAEQNVVYTKFNVNMLSDSETNTISTSVPTNSEINEDSTVLNNELDNKNNSLSMKDLDSNIQKQPQFKKKRGRPRKSAINI